MGGLPDCRMEPTPAFHVTFLDLFGPCTIRGVVNKRSRSKSFGVIFTCGVSRAVYCDVVQDYSTDSFFQTVRRFTSLRGYPSVLYSDSGSQLVKANKEIEHNKIKEFGVEKGVGLVNLVHQVLHGKKMGVLIHLSNQLKRLSVLQ